MPSAPKLPRAGAPKPDEVLVVAVTQEIEGPIRRLRGQARVETTEMALRADEIDYDEDKGYAEARGNVKFDHFAGGEHIEADRVEYDLKNEAGKYYSVKGSALGKVESRPGVLTTSSPFSFEGKWAERIRDRYILHDGFITNCKLPKPWWVLRGSTFDIVPGQRAIARDSVFWLKRVPLFYTPYFLKSLERAPRKSGFLTPNIGNSSRRGKMIGGGYYWAINRSYDAMYRAQLFTQRGVAHHVDFRGKPSDSSDFNFILYGVNDRGLKLDSGERRKEGGYLMGMNGQAELPFGFQGRANINYLSSFQFRQSFTESFFEAVSAEVHSTAFAAKHWSSFGIIFVGQRSENFQSAEPNDKVSIRKVPAAEFVVRDRLINERILPVWVSFNGSGAFMRRNQLLFQTRQYVDRLDAEPRISTALRWKDFHIVPSFSIRETHYGSSFDEDRTITGNGLRRASREFTLDFVPPAVQRIYDPPSWLGTRLKHVIEPRASYRYVSGVDNFDRIVRFDETELVSNTEEAQIGVTNRIFVKRSDGVVHEALTVELFQRRFFDPTFGGAVVEGQRNVILSTASLTGFSFLDGPRNYSPIVSTLRISPMPGFGLEWRTDYDPLRGKVVNSGLTSDARWSKYFVSIGHNQVSSTQVLTPSANQIQGLIGIGQEDRRGWSTAFSGNYDYREKVLRFATTQISYNTDCCGFSVQYRRFSIGTRNENQFRVAFAVANIGSFGTLKRQERIF